MNKRGWIFLIPAAVFAMLVVAFNVGLGIDPSILPSPLIPGTGAGFALAGSAAFACCTAAC